MTTKLNFIHDRRQKTRVFSMLALLLAPGSLVFAAELPAAPPSARLTPETRRPARSNTPMPQLGTDASGASGLVRIKDIADVQGVRGNQLIGYGLVVGLEGTGDGQSSQFTIQSIANMLKKFGVTVTLDSIKVKNVAAVMVTADLPPFVKNGSRIDVTVSSMGDAKSLQGGTLLQTPLRAANGEIYAVGQGALSIGGFNFEGGGAKVQKNHVNVGRIPHGAYVEQEVPQTMTEGGAIQVTLREPDYTTASRIGAAIRKQLAIPAQAEDAATIRIPIPKDQADDLIGFIARVETVSVTPDVQAKIVVNERTGTVAIGGNVKLAPGAISHGAIHIRIDDTPIVVPATPFTQNAPTVVVPHQDVSVKESDAQLAAIPITTTVDQLVRALNALGVTPRDLISILQLMRGAGMISAEIEIQ